ncbi:MAG TPA: hypothetical protein VNI20_05795, partial [Fimbriimonadaceae bacterium]|nr:hypothetical protein [Fimbriimonadaceae bacterium]
EYITSTTTGHIVNRKTVEGDVETGSMRETWNNVTVAIGQAEAKPMSFMDGFAYDPTDKEALQKPETFKGFPAMAVEAKNLVWDTIMFESFAKSGKGLAPAESKFYKSGDVKLAGAGTFTNNAIQLTGLGTAKLSGHDCRVMKYDAFFNKVEVKTPGMHLDGRSHYWGEIWVDATGGEIVLGTLYEDVLGDLTLGDAKTSTTINVLREGKITLQ